MNKAYTYALYIGLGVVIGYFGLKAYGYIKDYPTESLKSRISSKFK